MKSEFNPIWITLWTCLLSLFIFITPLFAQAAQPLVLQLPATPFAYADTTIQNHRATLGRVLFHDKTLSRNGLVSCASCHKQAHGFDDDKRFSIGFAGKITPRNSMGLANARFSASGKFFWDQRALSMQEQALVAFFDQTEMGLKKGQLVERVKAQDWYAKLFENAFGTQEISEQKIATALAQYVGAITSTTAPYDKARAQVSTSLEDFPSFTTRQNRGKTLFFTTAENGGAGCFSCHQTQHFISPPEGANNGLDLVGKDQGIGAITKRTQDIGKFKVPSLRNIAHRAPYMHDGRFENLSQVIEHYSSGIKDHRNLGEALKRHGKPRKFNFSSEDKLALIAFLETLSDTELMANEKFSNPFR